MCSGGTSGEETFSLIRLTGGIHGKCWRATCGFKTFLGFDKETRYASTATFKKKPHKVFTGDISDIPKDTETWLVEKYEIPAETLFEWQVGWCYDDDRLVLPILGPNRAGLGHTLRDLSGDKAPKAKSFRAPELSETVPLLAWYVHPSVSDTCIIVEDQLSAMKIFSLGFNAVALVGSDISLAKAMFIQKYFQKVVIFLDFDALRKVRLDLKKVSWLFKYTSILFDSNKRDPKDISREELRKKLREEIERIKDFGSLYTGQESI